MACRTLEQAGIHTLATTLFTLTQAVLAAEVGCTYVAPYVNQLKVHFEPGYILYPLFQQARIDRLTTTASPTRTSSSPSVSSFKSTTSR